MKWAALGIMPGLPDILKKDHDFEEAMMKVPQETLPQGAGGAY